MHTKHGLMESLAKTLIALAATGIILFVSGSGKNSADAAYKKNFKSSQFLKTPLPPVVTPVPPATSPAPTKKLWGAYVGDSTGDAAKFETTVNAKMNLQAIFMGAEDEFPSEYKISVANSGKTLIIFWEPYGLTLDRITSGSSDSYFKKFAQAAKAYGGPVIFVPFHEMNGNWDPWDGSVGTNSAAKVIEAFRHTHDLLSAAPNIKFGWAVNNDSVPNTAANSIAAYYPGDNYVDLVGVDGFNFGDSGWQTFSQVFNSSLSQISVYKKPVYIFSMASAAGKQKASWIGDFFTTQLPKHPEIMGWVWFNENKEQDWRVNSDPDSLKAFRSGIK